MTKKSKYQAAAYGAVTAAIPAAILGFLLIGAKVIDPVATYIVGVVAGYFGTVVAFMLYAGDENV